MFERFRSWLRADDIEEKDDSGWGLPLWWGAVVVALFAAAITWCGQAEDVPAVAAPAPTSVPTSTLPLPTFDSPTLVDVIEDEPTLTTFRQLVAVAGIEDFLVSQQYTFFAPSDDAFGELGPEITDELLADPDLATRFLTAHVLVGPFAIDILAEQGTVVTGSQLPITISEDGGTFFVDDTEIARPDLEATNGFVHVIDGFIGLSDEEAAAPDPSVGQLLAEREDLATLFAALEATGGELELPEGDAGFTLFAPTNDAFAELPAGSVEVLLTTQPKLLELLGYHIVPGRVFTTDLVDGEALVTSTGAALPVAVSDAAVTVGGVEITEPDIAASNGVVHIVDGVLLPPEFAIPTLNEALSLEPITFETGSATITDEGIEALAGTVEFLQANEAVRVAIEGHTDDQGDEASNQELSEARAEAVRGYLVSQGIAAGRMETAGFGETRPIADNDTPEGRAENRRIEFRLL